MKTLTTIAMTLAILTSLAVGTFAAAYVRSEKVVSYDENRRVETSILERIRCGLIEMLANNEAIILNVAIKRSDDKTHFTIGTSGALIDRVDVEVGIVIKDLPTEVEPEKKREHGV